MTIRDIAKAVGVTQTTVSNVINGNHKKVSQKTIDKVNKVIKETGYIPNKNARALANSRSKIIGVIFPHTAQGFMQNPFHAALLNGIETELSKHNYFMMVKSINHYDELFELMKHWSVEGFIILSLLGNQIPNMSRFNKTPVIFIDTYFDGNDHINIGTNDYQGEYDATKHLLDLGHERIGFVSYTIEGSTVTGQRLKGFLTAIKDKGLTVDQHGQTLEVNQIGENLTPAERLQLKKSIIDFVKDKSAICVSADILAIEIMNLLQEEGISIPDDLSVVGFDNLYMSQVVTPKLTTIHQDIGLKGALAGENLINIIEKGTTSTSQRQISPKLVIRNSTCPPKK